MWTFNPIYKNTIWGGQHIATFKGEQQMPGKIGESWEISDVKGYESVVASGIDKGKTLSQLIEEMGAELVGERNYLKYGNQFPLLIKLIDASENLSVQVHPDSETALRLGYPQGKSEMWYILDAKPGSILANGFKTPVNREDYPNLVSNGAIMNYLNVTEANPGDAFYIPAGRIHALGAGTLVLEIQQTSDVTFRVYDYNRIDSEGNPRELHHQQALESINFNDIDGVKIAYRAMRDVPVTIVATPHFTANLLKLDEETIRDYSEWDTFVVIIATQGKATIRSQHRSIPLAQGHSLLIPASANNVVISPEGDFTAIETYIK